MIYVTSDLHGHFDCLKTLLEYVRFTDDDWLYIIGDVIDRNQNGGVDILKWLLVDSRQSRANASIQSLAVSRNYR